MNRPFPNTVGKLISELDELIPEVLPHPKMTHDEIIFAGGRRAVVQFIKQWRDGVLNKPAAAPRPRGEGRPVP